MFSMLYICSGKGKGKIMAEGLTKRQQQVFDYVTKSINERGYPPTLREIGKRMGIGSTNGVNDHLKALIKKGYLKRDHMKSRTLRPAMVTGKLVDVPVVGRVAAGMPILAVENVEDTVRMDSFFLGSAKEVFALKVQGESMINDGIFDGDYIFVRKQLTANTGEIVVAMIEDEATVKRYYPEKNRIRFQPANDTMEPIYVLHSDFRSVDIIGVVIGVYRKMPC